MSTAVAKKLPSAKLDVIWFIAQGEILRGPYTSSQVEVELKSRRVSLEDFAWRQGFNEWRPLSSVEDFSGGNDSRLPAYPSARVPSGYTGPKLVETNDVPQEAPKPRKDKHIKISFAKAPRRSISVYEWALAIIFGVVLAGASTNFALNEVQRNFLNRLSLMTLGQEKTVGIADNSVSPPSFWDPIYSAPSLDQLTDMPTVGDIEGVNVASPLEMPVVVNGHPQKSGESIMVDDHRLQTSATMAVFESTEKQLDPVYSQTFRIKGYLSGRNANDLFVRLNGEPIRKPAGF